MNFRYIIVFFIFFYSFSQQQDKKNDIDDLFLGDSTFKLKQQKSLKSLDSLLVIWSRKSENDKHNNIQKYYLSKDIAKKYHNLSLNLKAIEFYRYSATLLNEIKSFGSQEKATFYYELCEFYYSISNNKLFKNNLIKAIILWENDSNKYSKELVNGYNKLINNYLEYGDINNAKLYLKKNNNLSVKNDFIQDELRHQFKLTSFLYKLRISLAEKKNTASESNYKELTQYFINLKNKTNYLTYYADATNFYAEAIFSLGRTNEALDLLKASIIVHKQIGNDLSLITAYSYLSYFTRELKDYNRAHQSIDAAIHLISPDNFSDLAGLYTSKAIIFFEEKNYKESEIYFDKAHQLIKRIDNSNFYLLSYNVEISKKYFEIYEMTGNVKLLDKSFKSYKYSVKQFQDFYENDFFNPLLSEYKNLIIDGLLTLGLKSENSLVAIIEMIENIQSKFLLKNYLLNNKNGSVQIVNELSEIKTLKLNLASISSVQKNRDSLVLKKTQIKNNIELLENKLITKYPNFNSILNPTFNFKDFILKNKDEIIRFYVTNTSVFGIYISSQNKICLKRIDNFSTIKEHISSIVLNIKSKKPIEKQSKALYNSLLKPFALKNDEITIVSNSFLNEIPFELLIDDEGKYIVEKYKINYSNSLLLYDIQRKHKNSKDFKLAIFQPNYKNKNLNILPFAEKEALYLQETFHSILFSNEKATKQNFINGVSNFNACHLSMHAIIDENNEEVSRLVFNDENFYFSDFYAQNLPLDLVVLSACETGIGKHIEGEGLMSLSRAFTYSGVSATIHSLWQTPDKQGYEIMQYFYEFLNEGLPKNEALQKAKIKFLSTAKASELKHPYYWSGFVLNGNSEALVSKTNYFYSILLGLATIVILLFFFLKFRK